MNAICLVVDRLHIGYLGAYGNCWIETPAFDRLAGDSFSFDQLLIDTPELERLYRSYWQGWHAMCPGGPADDRPALAALLREAGVNTALLTDDRTVAEHPLAVEFDELLRIDPPWEPSSAEQIEQTHFAQLFVEIINYLESAREPFLLWCHLAGLGTVWDAPPEFRRAYWEQGDPQPPASAEVPDLMLPQDHDPDQLLGITQSYAGQVALLDTCFGALTEYLEGSPGGEQTLLAVTSARGFPLGEHGRVGPCDEALFGELVHVPLMMHFPDATGRAARSQALVGPADLWATLLEWWQLPQVPAAPTAESLAPIIRQQTAAIRDRLCVAGVGSDRAIRTPAWYLRTAGEPQLFAKPDDRWEANDVANRCREVVERLQVVLAQCEWALESGGMRDLSPLGEVLLSGLE